MSHAFSSALDFNAIKTQQGTGQSGSEGWAAT